MRMRTETEVRALVDLARVYCETRAHHRCAMAEGRLSPNEDEAARRALDAMDRKLELLKSNSEVDRRRAARNRNIVALNDRGETIGA
jgi:hypothetical protein